jgi:excisionase family DNA binding protein
MSTRPTVDPVTTTDPPLLCTVRGPRGVCAETGWSPAFAYRLIEEGRLPAVRVGRSVRVMRSDLVAFLEAHRTGGDAA